MEEEERQRLTVYENKKRQETKARQKRIDAHEKIVSRTVAKKYIANLKQNTYGLLKDAGFFMDAFEEKIMHKDVMPWLYGETAKYTANLNSYEQYPNRMIVEFMADEINEHTETVQKHREAVKAKKLAIQREEEQKQIDKQRRREERAAKKKAAEIAALRETVEKEFISKGVPVEEILKSPLVEANGYGTKETPIIGMLGGWLGQIMIVFNTLAK